MDSFSRVIREEVEKMFPGATRVKVIIEGNMVKANASYSCEISEHTEHTMKRIDNNSCSTRKEK